MRILSYIAVMFTLLFAACSGGGTHEKLPQEISDLGIVAEYNPDSALRLFPDIEQKYANADHSLKMRIALMKYKAEDKSYVLHSSDSTIKSITAYYEENGTASDRLEAYYYMGGTYRDMRNYPLAIIWYLRGIDAIKEEDCTRKDSVILANLYGQIADAYRNMQEYGKMIENVEYSAKLKNELNLKDIVNVMALARSYNFANQKDSAYKYFNEAMDMIYKGKTMRKHIGFVGELLGFYVKRPNLERANLCYNTIKALPYINLKDNVYSAMASYHTNIVKKNDSAIHYFTKAFNIGRTPKKKQLYAKDLYNLYSEKGIMDSALAYAELYIKYTYIVDSTYKYQRAIDLQNDYMVKENERIETENKIRSAVYARNIFALILVLVILTTLTAVIFQRMKSKQAKLKDEIVELESEHNKLQDQLQMSHVKNTALQDKLRIYEKSDKHPNTKELYARFSSLKNNYSQKFAQCDYEQLEYAIAQEHPDFHYKLKTLENILKEKHFLIIRLFKIGLTQSEISRVCGTSRQNIHAEIKNIESILGIPVKTFVSSDKKSCQPS